MDHPTEASNLVQLIARLGHDLKSPLNAILGYCDLLGAELSEAGLESHREDVQGIRASAAHVVDLVDALVDLAKLTQGQSSIQAAPIALGPVVRDALAPLRPPGDVDGPPVEVQGGEGERVLVDALRLRRALVSATRVILDRAGNRRVTASIERRPEGVVIAVLAEDPRTGAPLHVVSETDGGLLIARSLCAKMAIALTVESDGRMLFTIPPLEAP